MAKFRRTLLFTLIFLSGASGLIYEVVWHRYLAILIGAQARATAITLAVFLGGISVGYFAFGRWSKASKRNLFKLYGVIEMGIALWGASFPLLYRWATPLTSTLYDWFGISSIVIDFLVAVLLLGVPTFLMGGTLPLLTQGMSEGLEKASRTHAMVYGINTLGACFGCLFAGYFLIPQFGLQIAVFGAAYGNLTVALFSYFYLGRYYQVSKEARAEAAAPKRRAAPIVRAILAVGFLSGFILLTLQTVLIRLMGLSSGASNYNFSLIVAIFILGLGLGSLSARKIAKYTLRHLFFLQLGISLSLLVLYLSVSYWPYWIHLVRVMFRDIPEAFYPYQLSQALLFFGILILPIGLAGLTLPLCFHLLKDRADTLGYRVGQLYGLNTLGCVLGALIGGYALFYFLNLDGIFKICGLLTVVSAGIIGFFYLGDGEWTFKRGWFPALGGAAALAGLLAAPSFGPEGFTQPFRSQQPIQDATFKGKDKFTEYLSRSTDYGVHKDGPNTSVGMGSTSWDGKEVSRTIFVNGKSDGNTRGDYLTTILLADIPGLLARKLDRSLIIGFGTGITIGSLAMFNEVKDIDVVEIEPFILKNKAYFDAYNNGVSTNKKVRFHEMDAFRYMEGTKGEVDIIISEPSNPWVAGVENLYSQEFYQAARKKLGKEGVFVQWIHTYSFNNDLLRMTLATLNSQFAFVSVWGLRGGDLALVATDQPFDRSDLKRGAKRLEENAGVKETLESGGIRRFESLLAHEVVPFSLARLLGEVAAIHQLERPRLSQEATRAFFVGGNAQVEEMRKQFKAYYMAAQDSLLIDYTDGKMPNLETLHEFRHTFCDHGTSKNTNRCQETLAAILVSDPKVKFPTNYDATPGARDVASLSGFRPAAKGAFDSKELKEVFDMFEAYKKFHSPIAYFSDNAFLDKLDYCMSTIKKSNGLFGECLLQKILILETVRLRGPEFKESVGTFLEWFETVPDTMKNYSKLKEARDLLLKMASING